MPTDECLWNDPVPDSQWSFGGFSSIHENKHKVTTHYLQNLKIYDTPKEAVIKLSVSQFVQYSTINRLGLAFFSDVLSGDDPNQQHDLVYILWAEQFFGSDAVPHCLLWKFQSGGISVPIPLV